MNHITATEAARNFSNLINRAKYGGEEFVVERNGEPMVEIRAARRKGNLKDLIELLRNTPLPDPDFADDVRGIITERDRSYSSSPWTEQ